MKIKKFVVFMVCALFFVSLTGCEGERVPKGYKKTTPPIQEQYTRTSGNWSFRYESPSNYDCCYLGFYVYSQFRELNSNYNDSEKMHFIYKDEVYYVKADGPFNIPLRQDSTYGKDYSCFAKGNDYSIIKENGETTIGELIKVEDMQNQTSDIYPKCVFEAIFLNENYLYYYFKKGFYRDETVWDCHNVLYRRSKVEYWSYEFYRFNLDTGLNEKTTLNLIFEKIKLYEDLLYTSTGDPARSDNKFILNKNYKGAKS